MRILIVHSQYRFIGGEDVQVLRQERILREYGLDVITLGRSSPSSPGNKYKLITAARSVTGQDNRLRQEIQRIRPEVIHVHNAFPNFGLAPLHDCEVPVVFTLHNYRRLCANGLLHRQGKTPCYDCLRPGRPPAISLPAIRHACYRNSRISTLPLAISRVRDLTLTSRVASRVITLSPWAHAIFSDVDSLRQKIVYLPNPVPGLNGNLGTPCIEGGWVWAGRLSPESNLDWLLNAWPSDERLTVFGDGPLRSTYEMQYRHVPNVRFLGHQHESQVLVSLSSAAGLIWTSQVIQGGIPNVIQEAVASRAPILALGDGPVAAFVAEQGIGLQFHSETGLKRVLEKVKFGRESFKLQQDMYAQSHSESAWVDSLSSIYQETSAC